MPADTDASIVIVQHLAPSRESMMAHILSRVSDLPVEEAEDGATLARGTAYVAPPGHLIDLDGNRLRLTAAPSSPLQRSVDHFFVSLARERGAKAVGIVLSGTGSDGAEGARKIQEAGGTTFVQTPESAEHDGMPYSAIAAGAADFVLPIETISRDLVAVLRRSGAGGVAGEPALDAADPLSFAAVLRLLQRHTGYDFRSYKTGTLNRRINRRMRLLKCDTLADYVVRLDRDVAEVGALFKDLLISVTRFFRDPAAWTAIQNEILPALVASKTEPGPLRVWCAGCATGEEAYTLAMLCLEEVERQEKALEIQIFATDIDEAAIAFARDGLYPASIAQDVSQERLDRFFVPENGRYRIDKRLRQITTLAVQNVVGDPPFSHIDLISCRNLMIYLSAEVQSRLIELMHFALTPGGYLFFGTSETLGKHTNLFRPVSTEGRIYQHVERFDRRQPHFPIRPTDHRPAAARRIARTRGMSSDWPDTLRKAMFEAFVPPAVVIDAQQNVQFYQGSVRRFLDLPEGEPTTQLTQLVTSAVRPQLRGALKRAIDADGEAETLLAVYRTPGEPQTEVRIEMRALPTLGEERLFVVSFLERPSEGEGAEVRRTVGEGEQNLVDQLEYELSITRDDLQSTIEELESSNEELKASNEEVLSINEELQTSNEELETSREELQSLNEELSTVNSQLEEKVRELQETNDDLTNLLASTDIATIFLDTEFRIRRFTPATGQFLNVLETDIGRPVSDLALKVNDARLFEDAKAVLSRLVPREAEVENADGRWFIRRALPYRTADDRIAGIVLTYSDATTLKFTAEQLAVRERQQAAIASLGQTATRSDVTIDRLLEEVTVAIKERLDVPLVKILQMKPDRSSLVLRAGTGWRPGLVGVAELPAGAHSQGGYTLQSRSPVIVHDLGSETRFEGPQLLIEHNVVSGLSVVVGPVDRPWGVVGAHTVRRKEFSADDINFVQAVANIIWATVERQQITNARHETAERLEIAIEVGRLATWDWDCTSGKVVWSDGHFSLVGYGVNEIEPDFELWFSHIHPDDRDTVRGCLESALEGDGVYHCEYRIIPRDGQPMWLEARGQTTFDETGKPVRMYGVLIDIEDRKRAEEQQSILLYELDHRVKNILANISALARQTRHNAESVEHYISDFTGRLDAIARAHTLLSSTRWVGASLVTLLEEELEPYRGKGSTTITIAGPSVQMKPDDAQLFAIAFHELATNAAKYGALSVDDARLDIGWRFEWRQDKGVLVIEWVERDGPRVRGPMRSGFGSTVLERLVPAQTQSVITLDFAPEGLRCRIEIDQSRLDTHRTEPEPVLHGPPMTSQNTSIEGRAVLIVEDSSLTAMDLEMVLEDAGATVVGIARTVEAAQAILAQKDVDVAVVDRNLQGEHTNELARHLLAEKIPFVFVTGYSDGNVPDDLVDVPLMNKPFDVEQLVSLLSELSAR
ncbi:PAS domain-containing protein [Acuticoccus sp. M5D2P5]|uniref:CheR family methyltransferase n=1 Tax=Acuticoccus kalidii TaxID=2910977 RepID=UPI001F2A64F7|nr:CheR family methyltransferase [Acuticoccus kalidii]MCF3933210.1 PAS domain-containing protein [Acuticoccus kalidii]